MRIVLIREHENTRVPYGLNVENKVGSQYDLTLFYSFI